MAMHKFLLNLQSKNAAAPSQSSLRGADKLHSLRNAAEDSRAPSCSHLWAAISAAQQLSSPAKGGGSRARLSAETAF